MIGMLFNFWLNHLSASKPSTDFASSVALGVSSDTQETDYEGDSSSLAIL